MNSERHERVRELLFSALERPPAERDSWLRDAAAGDADLVAEVHSLLRFHVEESDEAPSTGSGAATEPQPGDLFANRYRIVRRVGRGGMGEVFEARDETLGVTVALKRLVRADLIHDESFRNEVRLARQVTHPTVCRVYDLGEHEGERFLTMEFVDGEDLASLLRRVGRLPTERVAEIGRSLCVGLAAAHAQGVVHRDLKPGNILIDSDGRTHITDFGIAVLQDDTNSAFRSAGTPSYMAPEQLVPGAAVSELSDIYAVGLVLHEMLTGEPVFPGDSRTKVLDQRRTVALRRPSEVVSGVDPVLERVVLRCLRTAPNERPASVLQLAAALPGGDALGVAVDAGVTPPPELVADAHRQQPRPANDRSFQWFVALLVLLALVAVGMSSLGYFPAAPDDIHPQVRAHRAAALLRELGAPEPELGTFRGYFLDPTSREEAQSLFFWYREDGPPPRSTFQRTVLDPAQRMVIFDGVPTPRTTANLVVFDEHDRLVHLSMGVPGPSPQSDSVAVQGSAQRGRLFEYAGLDRARLVPQDPELSPVLADSVWAWSIADPRQPDREVHVELAETNGRAVYFSAGMPEVEAQPLIESRLNRVNLLNVVSAPMVLLIAIVGVVLAVRNHRRGRVDGVGTRRLVVFCAATFFLSWLLLIGYLPHPGIHHGELLASRFIFLVVINPLMLFVIYPAIEPGIRRFLPRALVGWSRVLRGDFNNRDVGWALLVGCTFGCAWALLGLVDKVIAREVGGVVTPGIDHAVRLQAAQSLAGTMAILLRQIIDAIARSGLTLLVFLLFRMRLKRERWAWVGVVLFVGILETLVSGSYLPLSWLVVGLPVVLSGVWMLRNQGLLPYIVAGFTANSLRFVPISIEANVWWARGGMLVLLVIFVLGVTGLVMIRSRKRDFSAGFSSHGA